MMISSCHLGSFASPTKVLAQHGTLIFAEMVLPSFEHNPRPQGRYPISTQAKLEIMNAPTDSQFRAYCRTGESFPCLKPITTTRLRNKRHTVIAALQPSQRLIWVSRRAIYTKVESERTSVAFVARLRWARFTESGSHVSLGCTPSLDWQNEMSSMRSKTD